MADFPEVFRFTGTVERFQMKGGWHYVVFPYDTEALFGTRSTVFMKGTVNGIPIEKSLMPMGDGRHFVTLPTELRKQAKLVLGSEVTVELRRATRPDQEPVPEELSELFGLLPDFEQAWLQLRGSVQRGILSWLASAKTAGTREKRAAEILRRYEEHISWFDGKHDRKTGA